MIKNRTNRNLVILIVLVAAAGLVAAPAAADSRRVADRAQAPEFLVGLEIDPATSIIRVLPHRSRDVIINSSFAMVSANCTDCGGSCPSTARSVDIVLEATQAVAGGYGVSDLRVTNFSVTGVAYTTQGALTADQQVTDTSATNPTNLFRINTATGVATPVGMGTGFSTTGLTLGPCPQNGA